MKFFIISEGDPDANVGREDATLETTVDHLPPEDSALYIRCIKEKMKQAFNDLWGIGDVKVITEDEIGPGEDDPVL